MNNYKKALDTQKQVNEAVDAIFHSFQVEYSIRHHEGSVYDHEKH